MLSGGRRARSGRGVAERRAGERPRESRAAGADKPGQADNLAAAQSRAGFLPSVAIDDVETAAARSRRVRRGSRRSGAAADHQSDEIVLIVRPATARVATFSPSRSTVRGRRSRSTSCEPVRDIEDQQSRACSRRMIAKRLSCSASDRTAVGSSRIRMRASKERARAISTSCCSATLRCRTSACGVEPEAKRSRSARVSGRCSRRSSTRPKLRAARARGRCCGRRRAAGRG